MKQISVIIILNLILNIPSAHNAAPKFCPFSIVNSNCPSNNKKYRTLDGSCNNPENSMIGKSITPYKRYLPPSYEDGSGQVRSTSKVDGRALPNPRTIGNIVHKTLTSPHKNRSLILSHTGIIIGQFVNHDVSSVGSTSQANSNVALKCKCFMTNNPDCLNVPTPPDDLPQFKDQSCMSLTRSGASIDKFDCGGLNPREQTNLQTQWLDLSQVYDNDLARTTRLRTRRDGLMRTSLIPDRSNRKKPVEQLPKAREGGCVDETRSEVCFETGDARSSQNLLLTSFHLVFLREHNRLARELKRLNEKWSDEDLFQEARRINVAKYQHYIYSEWIPVLIGQSLVNKFDLQTNVNSYFMGYNLSVNPHQSAEFSGAAFRFGHSMVRSHFNKADGSLVPQLNGNLTLIDIVLRPTEAYHKGGLDSICRGMLSNTANQFDPHLSDVMQNHLFENNQVGSFETHRFSLSTINIMRGRDHGVPTYNQLRVFAGLTLASSFDDLQNEISAEHLDKLKQAYRHVEDIDAFSGGLSETPLSGAVLGPTFAHIVGLQFRDMKLGDRFFYENGHDLSTRFTLDQLNEIRKSTMSRLMCDNLDVLNVIQRRAFEVSSVNNQLEQCVNIPNIDLSKWRNEKL